MATIDDELKDPESTELAPIRKLKVGKIGIAAKREQATNLMKDFDALKYPERIGIVFDNSGSMSGTPIQEAKKAVDEFLKVCNPQTTCVAIYSFAEKVLPLTNLYALLSVEKESFRADYSTPLYSTLDRLIKDEAITRAVVFSDGVPTDGDYGTIIQSYIDKKIPIDTVFIGHDGGGKELQSISERTGGVFLHFKAGSIFSEAFKYLAPAFRGLLVNEDVKKRIEKGEKF